MDETLDSRMTWDAKTIAVAVVWLVIAPVTVTFGDPPSWLMTHNMRASADALFLGYAGKKWDRDFGIIDGRCDRQALSAVVAEPGISDDHEAHQVATLTGPLAVRSMDEKDRACIGYALELGGLERAVAWSNRDIGTRYRVTPLNGYADKGMSCREFVTRVTGDGRGESARYRACTSGDGVWQIVG
jgi:surface antigen